MTGHVAAVARGRSVIAGCSGARPTATTDRPSLAQAAICAARAARDEGAGLRHDGATWRP